MTICHSGVKTTTLWYGWLFITLTAINPIPVRVVEMKIICFKNTSRQLRVKLDCYKIGHMQRFVLNGHPKRQINSILFLTCQRQTFPLCWILSIIKPVHHEDHIGTVVEMSEEECNFIIVSFGRGSHNQNHPYLRETSLWYRGTFDMLSSMGPGNFEPIFNFYLICPGQNHCTFSWSCVSTERFSEIRLRLFQSFWNVTGSSTAVLLRCLSNCRAIDHHNTQSCGFETSRDSAVKHLIA